ncbi:MAG: hypothetical protein AB8C02_18725 [Halioglobus sp.]
MLRAKLLGLLIILLSVACSHPLEIIGDGDIVSSTGENNCAKEDQPCDNYIVGNYDVTYTATPRTGSVFVGWDGCNSASPNCSFSFPATTVRQFWGRVATPLRATFALDPGDPPLEIDAVKGYVMGHSLWQHASFDYHTGEWLARFADHANKQSTWTGRFGQLDQHSGALPIDTHNEVDAAFGYPSSTPVVDAWTPGNSWNSVGFDHVVTMPWNFAQTDTPFNGTPDPLSYALNVVDFWMANAPTARRLILEHWPETSMVPGVPGSPNLSNSQWRSYWEFTRDEYHIWFTGFEDAIATARPTADISMIPVGPVLADLFLDESYMANVPSTNYFEDDAPHGLPALYFLSALVWYQQLYGVPVAPTYSIPTTLPVDIPNEVRNNFSAILAFIDSRLHYYNSQ